MPIGSRAVPRQPRARPTQPATTGGRNVLGWATLLLFIAGTIMIGLLARQQIVAAWPPTERLYMLIGVEAPMVGAGLEIRNVTSERLIEGKVSWLVVKGEVANSSKAVREVPDLIGRLQDSTGKTVHEWQFAAADARLLPGEVVTFEARIENPSSEADTLAISFVEGE